MTVSLTYISSLTASASSSLSFTGLSSVYKGFRLYYVNLIFGDVASIRLSTNNGSSYDSTSSYLSSNKEYLTTAASAPNEFTDSAFITTYYQTFSAGTFSGYIDLYFTNQANDFVTISGNLTETTSNKSFELDGVYLKQGAVDAIRILPSSGTITSGTANLFGIQ